MVLGQTPGNPSQVNNTNYYSFQNYVGAVQGFMLPQRDTNWTPSAPALVYRPADSSLYYWKWNKWQKVGGSMSSNDTSFSLYLLKTDFIDSLNNNRQTITRRNDSLFLTFGGSVSMVPDSTVFPTWFAINDSGYIKKETDPVFTSSPAYTITTLNINNWQTAYNSASTNGDTLILTSITGGVNKIPLLVSQDTTKFRGTGQGYGAIKTGNAKVYGDTLAYGVDTTVISYPTSVHDSVMSFGNSHNVTLNGSSTISVTGATQAISNNPSFSLSANNTQPLWNANQLNGYAIQNSIPTAGQILYFNGSTWAPNTFQPATGITSLGMAAGYGMGVASNTSNPITSYGTFTVSVDSNKIANLRYTDSALATKKNSFDSTAITGYSTIGGMNDTLNKINGINGWLYNPATKTGQVDSTKYSTVVATHDSIVANIPNLSIYTKYTDTSSMLVPYTKKGSNISQFNNDSGYLTPYTQANANWNATSGSAQILNKPNEINFNIYNQNEDSSVTVSNTTQTSIIKANTGSLLIPSNTTNTSFIGAVYGTCSYNSQTITITFYIGNTNASVPLTIATGSGTLPFIINYTINFGSTTCYINGMIQAGNNIVPISISLNTSAMVSLNYNIQAQLTAGTLTVNSSYLHRNVQ